MVMMMDPSELESIIDLVCGSGGLLVQAMPHAWEKIEGKYPLMSRNNCAMI